MLRVLTIQSQVAYGHVGNSAAVFPLQRLGHSVVAVPTVVFAHHRGHGPVRGRALSPDEVRELVLALEAIGALDVDLVLSGYLTAPLVPVVLDAVRRVRAVNPRASYTCDPVFGDDPQGVFVDAEVPALLREQLLPVADLATPNRYELGSLTGLPVGTLPEVVEAARALGGSVLVTGIEMVLVVGPDAWVVRTPGLDFRPNGSGDLTAALFSAHLLSSGDPEDALARTASSVYGVLAATHRAGARELLIVEAQEAIASPRCEFEVSRLS